MSSSHRGFSLIDTLVGAAMMLVVFLALFGLLRASLAVSVVAKAKTTALETANIQMEYLRGLSYDTLGTVSGIPSGVVPQTSTTTIDGIPYVVHTYIEYYDDPADGVGVSDTNSVTTDYKKGKVVVTYTINGLDKSLSLVSNFVPPGIESSTGGGTLALHIVNALGEDVPAATVHIVNTATTPTIDFTTVSDTDGVALVGGAATSSMYQIYVTRTDYSSAQTYPRTVQNVNPTPGYLTVVKDETTNATFAIDELATLILSTFSPATITDFTDSFTDASNIQTQTDTAVAGGLVLTSEALTGSALSTPITPDTLSGWGIVSGTIDEPGDSTVRVQVTDTLGTLLPDVVLPGNSTGFSTFPISLAELATSTYSSLVLKAVLTRSVLTDTPMLLDWSLSYTETPEPLPNIDFTLTGAKTIGTNGSGLPIYKTEITDTTGATGVHTQSLEWDAYSLDLESSSLIESCGATPYVLAPAQTASVALLIGPLATHTLPLVIENGTAVSIPNAKIILTRNGFSSTLLTNTCGFALFNGLSANTYTATVSAPGYTTTVFPGIVVSGHTATETLTLP